VGAVGIASLGQREKECLAAQLFNSALPFQYMILGGPFLRLDACGQVDP